MQFVKLGFFKIPYQIKKENEKKLFYIAGIRIPFYTYIKDNQKYYKIFGFSFRFRNQGRWFLTQNRLNYMSKEKLDQKKIEEIAAQIFKEKLGYDLDLNNPKTMNEKIFWLKLYYHDPLITRCCDKFRVKEYVEEVLGPGYVIPTIKSWEKAEDIDFKILPERYVLKVNWSSGYNIIIKEPGQVHEEEIREQIKHWMEPQQNSYYQTFNWGYKHMKPMIYAENYVEQMDGQLFDYKFFCCDGKVKFMFIATDRHSEGKSKLTYDFFDIDFQKLDLTYGGRKHSEHLLEKPKHFDEMIRCAEQLAKPFPFVRVDFYETEGRIFVGEMTFYSGGGILPFDPIEWDYKLGEYIHLPKVSTKEID